MTFQSIQDIINHYTKEEREMTLLEIEKQLNELNDQRKKLIEEYEKAMDSNKRIADELLRLKEIHMKGVDVEKVKRAESILRVVGLSYGEYSERCVAEAIKDISQNTNKMSREYFGVKNYAHWRHQSCDCKYGYGPSHGSIVFSIGLRRPGEKLTDEDKEVCLYYLNLLQKSDVREVLSLKKTS